MRQSQPPQEENAITAKNVLQHGYGYRIRSGMDTFATAVIDALGGTTAVSRATDAPPTTVQSWKKNGIPASRLAHLRLVAKDKGITLPGLSDAA
jgi:hypothetical protein